MYFFERVLGSPDGQTNAYLTTLTMPTNAVETGNWGRGFDYDSYGNMWVDPPGNGYTYGIAPAGNTPTSNIYSATTNQMAPSSNVGYDSRGNQSTIGGSAATYDAENHLVQYVEPPSLGGLSETYEYDGLGRRVAKLVGGATVAYIYDGLGRLAAEYTTNPRSWLRVRRRAIRRMIIWAACGW